MLVKAVGATKLRNRVVMLNDDHRIMAICKGCGGLIDTGRTWAHGPGPELYLEK